jgi:DNA-binding beta-propeller fold protein YncE
MAVDREGKRLFVCALGNNTVEVIDLSEGKRIHTIIGLSEPQDAIFLPDSNRLIVSNGGDGSCRAFDGKTYKPVELLDLKSDADNLRFDPKEKKIYIGYGD